MKMNRLQIVQKYMSASTKVKDIEKYEKAQRLSKRIIEKQDEKLWKSLVAESEAKQKQDLKL